VIHTLFESLGVIRESGVALLVVEQNIRTSLTAADRGYVLERGTVVRSGLASELLADPHIIDSYLGSADVTGASSSTQDRS
jgi:branched-chain amino acid transport system ATP-binding protein